MSVILKVEETASGIGRSIEQELEIDAFSSSISAQVHIFHLGTAQSRAGFRMCVGIFWLLLCVVPLGTIAYTRFNVNDRDSINDCSK